MIGWIRWFNRLRYRCWFKHEWAYTRTPPFGRWCLRCDKWEEMEYD